MRRRTLVLVTVALCFTGISQAGETGAGPSSQGSPYLFVWSGDAAHQATDFLAVIDANPSSPSYGRIVSSVPIGAGSTMPHHTEYEFPKNNMLFANGWVAGRTFIFDLNQPLHPRIAGDFQARAGYSFPHSFVRLPNGHLLPLRYAALDRSRWQGRPPGADRRRPKLGAGGAI
jgi:56kDa selenium binding protein (SBP56)